MKSLQELEQILTTAATPGARPRDRAIGWLGHAGVRLSEIAALSRPDIVFRPAEDSRLDLVATVAVGAEGRVASSCEAGTPRLWPLIWRRTTTLFADGDPIWAEETRGFPFTAFRDAIAAAHLTATGIATVNLGDLLASAKIPKLRYG